MMIMMMMMMMKMIIIIIIIITFYRAPYAIEATETLENESIRRR